MKAGGLAILVVLGMGSDASAQQRALQAGDRVRVEGASIGERKTGALAGVSEDSLFVRTGRSSSLLAVPWTGVTALAVSEPRTRRAGVMHGLKWGVGIGAAFGLLFLATPAMEDEELSSGELAVASVLEGAAFGAIIGAIRPGRRWLRLDVDAVRAAARLASSRASEGAAPAGPRANTVRSPIAGVTPAAEATFAFSAPTSRYAQFPGLLVAASVNAGRSSTQGFSLVAEADLSAYRYALMAGPRMYRRSAPLHDGRASVTYFGQVVAGEVRGEQAGVVRSVGGFVYQPGMGIDYGRGSVAGRVQVDYSVVPDGYVEDDREPGRVESLTRLRVAIGVTLRTAPW